jgi:RimJ/RimL family protein N-acetyltransferase
MIPGKHIVLRAIERDDLPRYVDWLNDPAVLEHFGPYAPLSLAQEEQWYKRSLGESSTRDFAIEFEGQHIGGAGFCHIDARNANAEVGLFIGIPKLWEQGLGRDVMRTLVRFGFEQMNLHRLYLRVFAGNARAIHLYEKLGFQREGLWRQAEFRNGRYHDMLWMGILRDEWRAR